MQEKPFDILRQENIWRYVQDLSGLIFMQILKRNEVYEENELRRTNY